MSQKINLSIIVPVYNTEKYLKECLNSIIDLEIDTYEIIIINDGSTDQSETIISDYTKSIPYIRYYYQENAGQGSARNFGIKQAKGKYIYFMDSDDILNSDSFTKIYRHLLTNEDDLDAVFFDGDFFLDNDFKGSNVRNKIDFNYRRDRSYGTFNSGEELYITFSNNRDFLVSPCLYIVKRKIYLDNAMFFPLNMKHEDEVFTSILMFYIDKCMHENSIVFRRRVRPNSTMTTINYNSKFIDHVKVLDSLEKFYNTFEFKMEESKQGFYNKMRNIYILALKLFNKSSFKNENEKYIKLIETGQKYSYFGLLGRLATKNIMLYDSLSRTYIFLRQFVNGWKINGI